MQQKLVPDLFIILVNNPKQPLQARLFLKVRYFERVYQKALIKRATLFFLSNPVPFNRQNYQKQNGISDQLLFRLQNKFRKIPFLVMYYLTKFDDVI